jgi:predicted nucleic acid-binding protein
MILVDTSVWVQVLKDKTGNAVSDFQKRVSGEV